MEPSLENEIYTALLHVRRDDIDLKLNYEQVFAITQLVLKVIRNSEIEDKISAVMKRQEMEVVRRQLLREELYETLKEQY
jgi:hypothetical protein